MKEPKMNAVAKHSKSFYEKKYEIFIKHGGNPAELEYVVNGKVNLDKFASDYDTYSQERKNEGGNRGHKSIPDILVYYSQYDTSPTVAINRQKSIKRYIKEHADEMDEESLEKVRKMTRKDYKSQDSKKYTDFLYSIGIDPRDLYHQARSVGMTSAEASKYVSQNLYGSP